MSDPGKHAGETHVRLELLDLPVEGVGQVPGGHDGDVDGEEDPHYQEQLRVLHHLDKDINKNWPDSR